LNPTIKIFFSLLINSKVEEFKNFIPFIILIWIDWVETDFLKSKVEFDISQKCSLLVSINITISSLSEINIFPFSLFYVEIMGL
jgi:hypothetical protein